MRYGMAIDIEACEGCHACTIACKSNNNLPNGVLYHKVMTDGGEYLHTARGTYPNDLHRRYYPTGCQHCTNAPCVANCPTGASYKREDGIVAIDQETCIGCGTCIQSCPYEARTLIKEAPEYVVDFPLGDWDAPAHKANTVEKCTFCAHRLARGEKPACMELCPGRARYWGDLDDPNSEISKVLASREHESLMPEEGTEPNVFYLK